MLQKWAEKLEPSCRRGLGGIDEAPLVRVTGCIIVWHGMKAGWIVLSQNIHGYFMPYSRQGVARDETWCEDHR